MTAGRLMPPTAAVLVALFAAGCNDRSSPRPATYVTPSGRNADPKRMSPKELHTFTAVSGIVAAAKTGQEDLAGRAKADTAVAAAQARPAEKAVVIPQPAPPVPPVPPAQPAVIDSGRRVVHVGPTRVVEHTAAKVPARPQPAIRLPKIKSDKPHPTQELARADALQIAQYELVKALQQLDPPVNVKPSLTAIRNEYVRRDTEEVIQPSEDTKKEWQAKDLNPNRVWVAFDVELSESQVQRLRAGERVNTAFQAGGVLFAVLLAVYGFLRLDAWTKGYLTSWLAIGAVALVVIAALAVLA